jgi:hypothetical protein
VTPEPELTAEERDIADRLIARRPAPAAGFRGALGRHLAERDPGYGPRPARLTALSCACLATGALLLGLGAAQAAGVL